MAVLLMKLRLVPDDELAEIEDLLQAHELEFYTTTAGNWGISMPALWLVDDSRREEAKNLLEHYAVERQRRAREIYEAQRDAGKARTLWDMASENPLRWLLSLVMVAALLYVSLVPFW
jgi:hypothetical protein